MGDLWGAYLTDVAAARSMDATKLRDYADNFDVHVRGTSGDLGKLALDFGLVDHVAHRDELRARIVELVGEDTKKHQPHQVSLADYVKHWRARDLVAWGKPKQKIGVVIARGMILDGEQPPGTVGGDSTAALIRKARLDDDVVAIVLRVDSPGGSAFASEIIRRELQLVRDAGKPVVVSMGSVAASGGYWISTSADEIWASPTTITGSIGIFGMFPGLDRMLDRYVGVRVDGVATGPFADGIRPDRPLDPRVGATIQLEIEKGYRDFLTRVANARGMTVDAVDAVAQGRVWSGSKAKELGLVDALGDLDDAVAAAAKRAEVEKYRVEVIRKEPGFAEALAEALAGENVRWSVALPFASASTSTSPRALGGITGELVRRHEEQLRLMSSFNDPNGVYAWAPVPMD
jgi:protease-4